MVFSSDSWGHKVGQASWSPSSGVIVQTGLGRSQRGIGLARPGALHIRFLSSAPWPERKGLEGMGLGHRTLTGVIIQMSPWHFSMAVENMW